MLDEQRTSTLPHNAQIRNYVVYFGLWCTGDCMNNITDYEWQYKPIFQMACILKPECNFLHGYFRCLLPLEMVDVKVKMKMMRGIHTFKRDRTTQVISCNPWCTRLHPYPSLIRKMKMYLALEGKLGPQPQPQLQPNISTPSHDRNSLPRNTLVAKKVEKKGSQGASKGKV